jgi:hypothetical protein
MEFIYLHEKEQKTSLAIALSGAGKGLRGRKDRDDLTTAKAYNNISLIRIVAMNPPKISPNKNNIS